MGRALTAASAEESQRRRLRELSADPRAEHCGRLSACTLTAKSPSEVGRQGCFRRDSCTDGRHPQYTERERGSGRLGTAWGPLTLVSFGKDSPVRS